MLDAIKIEARIALVDAAPLSDLDYRFFRRTLGRIIVIVRRHNMPDAVLIGAGFYAEARTWGGDVLARLIATRRARRP